MNNPLKNREDELRELCEKYRVKRLVLFGSAVRDGSGRAPNDLDFLVEFEAMPPSEHAGAYFGLLESLQEVFQMPVDLVEPGPIRNPYFKQSVQEANILLYEAA